MSDNKSRDIFYGVVAIATLIVALVGATLAYFSISANSNPGAVNAKADKVSISYKDSDRVTAQADKLIPSSFDVVQTAYENAKDSFGSEGALGSNICVDSPKDEEGNKLEARQVCSIYRFSVNSDSDRQMTATLYNDLNEFETGLSYALYDVNNNEWKVLDDGNSSKFITLTYCSNEATDPNKYCYTEGSDNKRIYNGDTNIQTSNSIFGYTTAGEFKTESITAGSTQEYDLVIFLKERGNNQNEDQGASYQGTIFVEVVDSSITSGQITGRID